MIQKIHTSERVYTVTFIKPVAEIGGYDVNEFEIGDTMQLKQREYNKLKKGETIERNNICGGHGYYYGYEFDKSHVANEATFVEIETSVIHGVAKLGKRKQTQTK